LFNAEGLLTTMHKLSCAIFGVLIVGVGLLILAAYRAELPPPTVFYEYVGVWGGRGDAEGEFESIEGITVAPDGRVLVSDSWNARLQYFTSDGNFLRKWEGVLNGGPIFPGNISFAPNGDLYMTINGDLIAYLDPNGSIKGSWRSYGQGRGCLIIMGLAVAPNGDIYTVDSDDSVQYFSPEGSFKGRWGSGGKGDGQFTLPSGIAVGRRGWVYVADSLNYRVQYFTSTGSFLGKWGSSGEGYGQFDRPLDVEIGPGGNVYVADGFNNRFEIFTATGSFLGACKLKFEPVLGYGLAQAIAVGPSGDIYVADGLARIQYFRPAKAKKG
jgi:tripartite motif-containing protein 71